MVFPVWTLVNLLVCLLMKRQNYSLEATHWLPISTTCKTDDSVPEVINVKISLVSIFEKEGRTIM